MFDVKLRMHSCVISIPSNISEPMKILRSGPISNIFSMKLKSIYPKGLKQKVYHMRIDVVIQQSTSETDF